MEVEESDAMAVEGANDHGHYIYLSCDDSPQTFVRVNLVETLTNLPSQSWFHRNFASPAQYPPRIDESTQTDRIKVPVYRFPGPIDFLRSLIPAIHTPGFFSPEIGDFQLLCNWRKNPRLWKRLALHFGVDNAALSEEVRQLAKIARDIKAIPWYGTIAAFLWALARHIESNHPLFGEYTIGARGKLHSYFMNTTSRVDGSGTPMNIVVTLGAAGIIKKEYNIAAFCQKHMTRNKATASVSQEVISACFRHAFGGALVSLVTGVDIYAKAYISHKWPFNRLSPQEQQQHRGQGCVRLSIRNSTTRLPTWDGNVVNLYDMLKWTDARLNLVANGL